LFEVHFDKNLGMFFRYCLIFSLIFSLFSSAVVASHIVGGELNYRYLGANVYEVRLVVYRDCFGGQAPFDDPASIGVFNMQGNLVASSDVYVNSINLIPNIINSPCLTPPTNICYEVGIYTLNMTLPPIPGGYQLVYQRCCRNYSILNIDLSPLPGATYLATIPDTVLCRVNSNPEFNFLPPTFICEGAPFTFDHSATDIDGDSIVYEICTPLLGANQGSPQPIPPNGPPYNPIVWQFPYSEANPFGGVPLDIDPVTGRLTATPASSGQFVYGVCAKEYRNGVYLGETKRDFQVNVVPCPMITIASIFSPTIACGSLQADFLNQSYNAASYSWDFGDLSTFLDSSSDKNPSWTYPDTGVYMATLIAYSATNPGCNDTTIGEVRVHPAFYADFEIDNIRCTPDFTFRDKSIAIGKHADYWEWDLGDGTVSSDTNISHTYSQAGLYEVRLVSSADSSCLDTVETTVSVLEPPVAEFSFELDTCLQKVSTLNLSQNTALSLWNFNDAWVGPEDQPSHRYNSDGVFRIQLIALSDSACRDSSSQLVSVPPLAEAAFQYEVTECDSVVKFSNLSQLAVSYKWNFGDEIESTDHSPVHSYSLSGTIPVTLISTSAYSCPDTLVQDIFFISRKKAAFESYIDSCSGLVHFVGVPQNATEYLWDFGDGTRSRELSPSHAYSANGAYKVNLTTNPESSCMDSVSHYAIFEGPLGELLFVPTAFTPNGDGLNDVFKISVFRPCDRYSLSVFNRWGQMIFEAEDAQEAIWDGTFKGQMAEEGVYVYLLKSENGVRKGVAYLTR